MKKFFIFFVSVCFFISCQNMYRISSDRILVERKTTIKTFEHLNEPIVIALPVYEPKYLFGKKKNNSNGFQRIGDIIAVIDIEKNEVFDWVFHPGEHGWSAWRCTEIGQNPTRYYHGSKELAEIACLDPTKTTLEITKADMANYTFWHHYTPGKYGALVEMFFNSEYMAHDMSVKLYDIEQKKIVHDVILEASEAAYILELTPDSDGNFWVSYQNYKHENITVKINCETGKKDVVQNHGFRENNEENIKYHYDNGVVTDKYFFLDKGPLGVGNNEKYAVEIFNKNENKILHTITGLAQREGEYDGYISNIIECNKKIFVICMAREREGEIRKTVVNIFEITGLESNSPMASHVEKIYFDATENVYVRGTKIYFMRSRNPSDVTYCYYDTATDTVSDIFRVSAEKLMNDYGHF